VVWDIGANIGLYSLQLALYNPPKEIVAFEFHPETARLLSMHIEANGVGDLVKVMQIAVTDGAQADLEVSLDGSDAGDPCARTTLSGSTSDRRVRVRAASIDSLIEEHDEAPTFLKIDVEGAEYDVLAGARKLLKGVFGTRPLIMMAAHPMFIGEFGRSLADVTALVHELGYVSLTSSGQPEDPERYDEFWLVPAERQVTVARVLAGG
jgi:FkbM family methyltransferase